jgi:hypothetical protein
MAQTGSVTMPLPMPSSQLPSAKKMTLSSHPLKVRLEQHHMLDLQGEATGTLASRQTPGVGEVTATTSLYTS